MAILLSENAWLTQNRVVSTLLGGEEAKKTLGKYTTIQKQVGDGTQIASHSEMTSGQFGRNSGCDMYVVMS